MSLLSSSFHIANNATKRSLALLFAISMLATSSNSFSPSSPSWSSSVSRSTKIVSLNMFNGDSDDEEATKAENGTMEEKKGKKKIEMQTMNPLRLGVLKLGLTELRWTSPLNYEKKEGMYECAGCGSELFSSFGKYDSGSGWPSFWRSHNEESVSYRPDMNRLEVICKQCEGHLGHVFPDGPKPNDIEIKGIDDFTVVDKFVQAAPSQDPKTKATGSYARLPRFCVNGASMRFVEKGMDVTGEQ